MDRLGEVGYTCSANRLEATYSEAIRWLSFYDYKLEVYLIYLGVKITRNDLKKNYFFFWSIFENFAITRIILKDYFKD